MREINNKEDYQKVVFALYISNSSKEVSTVLGNVLDWSMNFNQLVSEYVDYVFLRDYFSDHPELVAFYEKEISLFGEERDTRRQIVEKVFHTFKQRFSFA